MSYLPNSRLEEVKTTIRSCLVTHKEPVTIKQLNSDYHNFEEENIPYKEFNFKTLLDFLYSLTSVLRVIERNGEIFIRVIDTENTRHISSLVAGQKPAKGKKSKRNQSSGLYGNNRPRESYRENDCFLDYSKMRSQSGKQLERKYVPSNSSSNSSNDNFNCYNNSKDDEFQRSKYVNPKEEKYNDSAKCDTVFQKSHQVSTTSNDKKHVIDNSITIEDNRKAVSSILINTRVIERLKELIENHPNGIWCAELPTKYLDTFSSTLNYMDLGFESVREFASCLPNVFHCIQIYEFGDYKLYNAKNPSPTFTGIKRQTENDSNSINNNVEVKAIPSILEPRTVKNFIPDNVMNVTESVGQIMVKDLCKIDVYEEVNVCEVFSPTYFFCHLRKNSKSFKKFMIRLHSFYEENKSKYQIPSFLLKEGLNVACLFDNKWHRAIIKTVKPEEEALVHFYDYGTVKTYGANEMYFLHKSFTNLPAQAILCGLHNVKPIGKKEWEKGICHELIQKSKGPLCAMISSINEEENSAIVSLINTSGDEDLCINDWLIMKKFATMGRLRPKKNRNFTFLHYMKSLQHKGYDTSNIKKNTEEPILKGSFKFSGSEISAQENESTHKTMEKNSTSAENTLKHHLHQEKRNRNIKEIPSLLSLNLSTPSSIKLKDPTIKSEVQVQENNKSEEQVSCPKILKRTLALILKNQKKKEEENSLSPLTSESSKSSTESSKLTVTNSSTTSKMESKREILLRLLKSSSPSDESKSKNSACQPNQHSSEKKITDENCEAEVNNSSEVEQILENESTSSSSSETYVACKPLHFKEVQEEKIPEFGTLRSELGGHGRMQPIDWHNIRTTIKKCEIKKTICRIESNINEKSNNCVKSIKKTEDSKKSCQTIAKEDVPKLLNISQQTSALIEPELTRSINNTNIKSNFFDKEFNFLTITNVKSSTTPISPLLKLKQRLHANSFQSESKLINLKLVDTLTCKLDESKKINETIAITHVNDSLEVAKNDKIDKIKEKVEPKIEEIKVTEISTKEKELVPTKRKIQVLSKTESLDSDDFSDDASDPESDKFSLASESTIHEKSSIQEESSIEGELANAEESIEKKEIIPVVKENLYVFNDMDVSSDSEIWDGLSFSGEIASTKYKSMKSVSSRVSSPTKSIVDVSESYDSNIMNFQYNEFMTRNKQEENSKKIINTEAIEERNSSNSSSSTNSPIVENNLSSESSEEIPAIKNFKPAGRAGSLMRMLSNIQKELK